MNLPESCLECYEIVKSFEVVLDGNEESNRYKIDVLFDLKDATKADPYSVRYYKGAYDGPWVHLLGLPWVAEKTADYAAENGIRWLCSKLGKK